MKKIRGCAIGERDIIRIFGAYAFDLHPVTDVASFNQEFNLLVRDQQYDIFIITETFIVELNKENTLLVQEKKPIVLTIPTNLKSAHSARGALSDLIRKAVGIDLLSNEKGAG